MTAQAQLQKGADGWRWRPCSLVGRKVAAERDVATVAACVAAVSQGADMVRVHNVPMVAEGLRVADAVFRDRVQKSMQEGDQQL